MKNEADTRATLIDPKLKAAEWADTQITREHYYQRDQQYTQGRVILVGNRIRRGEVRKVDYLLRLSDSFPIAVVEAKSEGEAAEAGLEQAKRYARDLGIPFAYATNGHQIVEFDFFTNSTKDLKQFPTPGELWERWQQNQGSPDASRVAERPEEYGVVKRNNPLLYPYCPKNLCGKMPFYFQEVAIREVIKRFIHGQKRVLLTMATGTGKTFVAFQIVWKLVQSGWLQRRHSDRPGRVLFLADRAVLRDQAYNTFAPFADGTSEPRFKIEGHPANLMRDLYFGIYQTLWSPDEAGKRLFEKFPRDFFDLVIIDECHRSGFGTYREILDHFGTAMQLGMTATPKQDENVDTYAYFCAEEPEIAIDPDHPERGTWRPPAYQYSLSQGIEDGFLATYKVHRVRTTVDATGLHLQDAIEQGAEVFIPDDVEPRDFYTTPQFEREISLPDRTGAMVSHLAGLLRRFGPREKTMVFCVDMEHARLVARLLQDEFGPETGLSNYAVPIISEEGEEGRRALEAFADSDKPAPVVATTAELLSTGVDVPSCRNIVFMKTLSSPTLFKQIVGRGSRLDFSTGKYWFRIIDYTGATRLFDEWDCPPLPPPEPSTGSLTAAVQGQVFHADTQAPIVEARVSIRTGPNSQRGPILTDENGRFQFPQLPAGSLQLVVSASGFTSRTLALETAPDETLPVDVPLKPALKKSGKICVEGLEVTIADEAVFLIEETRDQLTLEQYRNYTRQRIRADAPNRQRLRDIWVDSGRRQSFLAELRQSSIHPEILAEVLGQPEADAFDLLCHIAFGSPIRTRSERAEAFRNREQAFINAYKEGARKVILELLEKYRVGGIEQLEPEIFGVSPFREWGGATTISRWFGDLKQLGHTMQTMREKIYAKETVT
ncbi:DEAD/DEAH box helicase family protein [Thermosynechococcus sp. QS41]|uniref:EcoAI/FtnUII family type I restriction enzme subunit R n=1 Tax=Thermosynechococcus sp. QS41 TaxID=3074101 RepID=UPI002877EEF2|nr:DEAD/DEAH box helicase family protein [Thermosynechococcus sp. QS41]WNC60572.1 DEAD/DEAH box helicase family protein [Thermosynechococcus sp. QS41]